MPYSEIKEKICATFGVNPHLIADRPALTTRYQESEEAYAYWEQWGKTFGYDLPMDDLVFEAHQRRVKRDLGYEIHSRVR